MASLVVGIIGVVAGLIPFIFFLAWVLGVLAVVFGLIGLRASRRRGVGRGQALAGSILGGIAVALGIVGLVLVVAVINDVDESVDRALRTPRATGDFSFPSSPSIPMTTTPMPKQAPIGALVPYENGSTIQVFSYEQPLPQRYDFDPAEEVGAIDVQFCGGNTSSPLGGSGYNPLGFHAVTADNFQHEAGPIFDDTGHPSLSSGDLLPGNCVRGWVGFDMPNGVRPSVIVWNYPGWEEARWTVG